MRIHFRNNIYRGIIFCLFIILNTNHLNAQSASITGFVIDASNDKPIEYASVYISGTTKGTSTKEDGSFVLFGITKGINKIVVSMIGYEAQIFTIEDASDFRKGEKIKLQPKVYDFSQIDIEAKEAGDWKILYKTFEKQFLGSGDFAGSCIIENKYILNLNEKEGVLYAACREPLKIYNKALGYKINCILHSFSYDYKSQTVTYVIDPQFIECVPSSSDSISLINRNRVLAYTGSTQHLLRSLLMNGKKFEDEGFELSYLLSENKLAYIESSDEIVFYDNETKLNILSPQTGSLSKINRSSSGLNITFRGKSKNGSSQIFIKARRGISFSSEGRLLYPEEFMLTGVLSESRMSDLLPSDWEQ